jgi:hypothetical protein
VARSSAAWPSASLPLQDRQLAIALRDLCGISLRHHAVRFALLLCLAGTPRSSACAA